MKKLLTCLLLLHISAGAYSQVNSNYDKHLADSLGADEYGMKMYTLVILKTGITSSLSKKETDSIFVGHLHNIQRLAKEGKLVAAGPLGKNDKSYRGIFILNSKNTDEAKQLLQTDPAIHHKLLDAEVFPWYGSAALPMYLNFHDKVQKKSF